MKSRMLSPTPVRVTVHLVKFDGSLEGANLVAALPEGERTRAAEIRPVPQRNAFLATRKLLRELLAARIGCSPTAVPILQERNQKPRLGGGGIEFSSSHCDGWCAVALSADCPVGVDVEPIRPFTGMDQIVAQFFPREARAAFAAARPEERLLVFFRWWTVIEAALKAAGRGLHAAVSSLAGVVHESCEVVRGLALGIAAQSDAPLSVTWFLSQWNRALQFGDLP